MKGVQAVEMFNYVKHGYNPEEVNSYINTLEQVIKSYKDKDNAIKNAIISAQVAADNIIKNAQAQAQEYKIELRKQLQGVKESIEAQRRDIKAFQDTYNAMLRKYIIEIERSEIFTIDQKLLGLANSISNLETNMSFETTVELPEAVKKVYESATNENPAVRTIRPYRIRIGLW